MLLLKIFIAITMTLLLALSAVWTSLIFNIETIAVPFTEISSRIVDAFYVSFIEEPIMTKQVLDVDIE